MRATRRHLLKGFALLPGLAAPLAPALAAAIDDRTRFIVDTRLPGGKALAKLANAGGHQIAEPRGEIIAEFLGEKAGWLDGPAAMIGLTGYSEMVLMRDLARTGGRPMRYAARWGSRGAAPLINRKLDDPMTRLIASLQQAAPAQPRTQASSFLWIV